MCYATFETVQHFWAQFNSCNQAVL